MVNTRTGRPPLGRTSIARRLLAIADDVQSDPATRLHALELAIAMTGKRRRAHAVKQPAAPAAAPSEDKAA